LWSPATTTVRPMPQVQRRINRTIYFELIGDASFGAVVTNNDSQRQGFDLHLLSKVRVSSHHVPPRSVSERRREGPKCQKNRTIVGKFGLGQAEEDSDCPLLLRDNDNDRSRCGVRSRDATYCTHLKDLGRFGRQ
jgi:hypothetical protein